MADIKKNAENFVFETAGAEMPDPGRNVAEAASEAAKAFLAQKENEEEPTDKRRNEQEERIQKRKAG